MDSLVVPLQVVTSAEALSTQLALVRFLSRVSPEMLAKVFLGEKLFTTVVAPVTMFLEMRVEPRQANTCEV